LLHPDVDEFLVDKRNDEVLGRYDDADIAASSFFFIDKNKSIFDVDTTTTTTANEKDIVGPVDVRKLNCFAHIYRNTSAVKDPVVKRFVSLTFS
jgi:hypothetical protein